MAASARDQTAPDPVSAPDPRRATCAAGFLSELRALKIWSGNPSVQTLARRSGVPRSTVGDVLSPRRQGLPRLDLVLALVGALGVGPDGRSAWQAAWKTVQRAEEERRAEPGPMPMPAGPQASSPDPASTPDPVTVPAEEPALGRNFLPTDIPDFAGRAEEIDLLVDIDELADPRSRAVVVAAIDGMAGVGKTTLAIHAAHRLAEEYTDGQFFIDLRAHTPGQTPLEATAALEQLLRGWGLSGDRVPDGLVERSAAWRSAVAGRRILLVLDNAASAEQVRPLLPGSAGAFVLVTSRVRLTSLTGARTVSLDVLPALDATSLFTRIVGDRALADPAGVAEAVALCGHLPLAIRIAAARLRHRSAWTVAHLADRLRDRRRRLGELASGDLAVAGALDISFRHLAAEQQRVFRLLGLHPGSDIGVAAAAALAGLRPDRAEAVLEDLLDVHLLDQHTPDRYTCHDLVRLYTSQLAATAPESVRSEALRRMLDHYRYAASAAMSLIEPDEIRHQPAVKEPENAWLPFSDPAAAARWLDAEQANVLAAIALAADEDLPEYVRDLPAVLWQHIARRSSSDENLDLCTRALQAARRIGEPSGIADASRRLGLVYFTRGCFAESIDHLSTALDLHRSIGNAEGEARALTNLGLVLGRSGRTPEALVHHRSALELSRRIGDGATEAVALSNLGPIYTRLGDLSEALAHQRETLALHERNGSRTGQAIAQNHLGELYRGMGRHQDAMAAHEQALLLHTAANDHLGEAETRLQIGETALAMGEPARALLHYEAGLAHMAVFGEQYDQAVIHLGLARAHHQLGSRRSADSHARRAHELFTTLGVPMAAEARELLDSLDGHSRAGEPDLERPR